MENRFTFQFFPDHSGGHTEIVHGTIEQLWPLVLELNTIQRRTGVFVTTNATDFHGRRTDNIVRARALFADADGEEQVRKCAHALSARGIAPGMKVRTGNGQHVYFLVDDVPLEQFSAYQKSLITILGTDPAVSDLPRVMRLPGTLHLKDPGYPRLVTLDPVTSTRRWKLSDLCSRLGLSPSGPPNASPKKTRPGVLSPADPELMRKLFGPDYLATCGELSAGLDTNVDEIRSAALAIPASAISSEPEWMKFARALAHEAAIYKDQAEQIWQILDAISRSAPGYNEAGNRERWDRYIREAFEREAPITIATVFDLAKRHGWQGWSPPTVTLTGNHGGSFPARQVISAGDADPLDFVRTSADEAVARINNEYFFRRDTSEICRQDTLSGEIQVLSRQQFETALAGRWVDGDDPKTGSPKVREAAKVWLESRQRREVHGVQYCPNSIGLRPQHLNLWLGWGVQPAPGACAVVLDHVRHVIAAGDEQKAEYLLNWCADIFQNATRKPGVAIVLRGREGTGKSVLGGILRRLLGPRNVLVNADKDRLLGRFNSAMAGKILVQAEESFFAGDARTTDALKHLITGQTLEIELKFGRSFEIDSFHRLLITSNHVQVIQASSEARRFVVYDVPDTRRGDSIYFDRLYSVADGRDDATAAAFMYHLLNRDLSNFQPWAAQQQLRADGGLGRQRVLSLTPPLAWLYEVLRDVDGEEPGPGKGWLQGKPIGLKWPTRFRRSEALRAFRDWASIAKPHGGSTYTGSDQRFWNEIVHVIPRGSTSVKDSDGHRCVTISLNDLKACFLRYLQGAANG
jgi:hypothetical protein